MFLKKYKNAVTAFKDVTSQQRGYLLTDFRVNASASQRLRASGIFLNEAYYLHQ